MANTSEWPAEVSMYVTGLPIGLESYPDCVCKGTVWRAHAEAFDDQKALAAVAPDPVARLLAQPPGETAWIPETHFNALLLLLRARRFPSDEAFLQRLRALNRQLLSSALYRILFAVSSPRWVVSGAAGRWGAFHRGVGIEVASDEPGRVLLRLRYPRGLVSPLVAQAYVTAFDAALELSGGKDREVSLDGFGPEDAEIVAAWS